MFADGALTVFLQVVSIDLLLAGDNAVVIGLAAAGLPKEQRGRAILIGVIAATVMRILFALVAAQLLAIIGLLLAGGLLLLWVAWKMWRELQHAGQSGASDPAGVETATPRKTMRQAVIQIVAADVSMSLDNVLGVAGAAREHPVILVFGLALSVLLMGVASTFLARVLTRYRWIAFIGLAVIVWVALHMIWEGTFDVAEALNWPLPGDSS